MKGQSRTAAHARGIFGRAPAYVYHLLPLNVSESRIARGHLGTRGPTDLSEIRPGYNEASLLETVNVRVRDATAWTALVDNIDYNAKGQREQIVYGGGATETATATTVYMYDAVTVPPRAVFAFWSNLDTRRSVRNPKSLFDDTFLVGTPGTDPFPYAPATPAMPDLRLRGTTKRVSLAEPEISRAKRATSGENTDERRSTDLDAEVR